MRSILLSLAIALSACATPARGEQTPQAAGMQAVATTDVVWAHPADLDLKATIYRPAVPSSKPLPVLIDVHGGAWGSGDRTGDVLYATELAKGGVLVVSIDFRQSPKFQHPAGSADVAAAVRYVRLNAKTLGADPDRIGLIGSSSGAHLALLASLRPDASQHKGTPIADASGKFAAHDEISAKVDYVVAMWPVSDPAARYRYAKRAGIARLAELTEKYFPSEDAMWDASIQRIVTSGEAKILPPILVVQPGDDSNIPQEMTFDLLHAWQARVGRVDYLFYPGQPHAFGHRPSAATTDLMAAVAGFIARQNQP
ncbi:MAG: alpha/beta hydrolase [Hyphomonadaceae bacterium]